MATINVPADFGNTEFHLEGGYLIAPEGQESILPGGDPAIDLFAQVKGNVTDAVEFILNLSSQGVSA